MVGLGTVAVFTTEVFVGRMVCGFGSHDGGSSHGRRSSTEKVERAGRGTKVCLGELVDPVYSINMCLLLAVL